MSGPLAAQRSTGDVTATVLLFVAQLVASAASLVMALGRSLWVMMPICSDNCDSLEVTHFVHKSLTGAVVSVIGIALAFLLAGIGALVAGLRRSRMWKWPALGITIVVISFLVAVGVWTEILPSGS